jgi:DNA-binding response OmpR family regulator
VLLFNCHREIELPKGPLVAIVDDDESIRETTKDLLESAGFSTAVFAGSASLLKSRRLSRVSCSVAVVGYLIKLIAPDELLACVRRALQRHDAGGEQR